MRRRAAGIRWSVAAALAAAVSAGADPIGGAAGDRVGSVPRSRAAPAAVRGPPGLSLAATGGRVGAGPGGRIAPAGREPAPGAADAPAGFAPWRLAFARWPGLTPWHREGQRLELLWLARTRPAGPARTAALRWLDRHERAYCDARDDALRARAARLDPAALAALRDHLDAHRAAGPGGVVPPPRRRMLDPFPGVTICRWR